MDTCDRLVGRVLGCAGDIHLNKQDIIVMVVTWASVLAGVGVWWLVLLELL